MKIAAAAYPLDWFEDEGAYAAKIESWVAGAVGQGAEILVFPEYGAMELASLAGPAVKGDEMGSLRAASDMRPVADRVLSDAARRHGVHILGGSGPCYAGDRLVNRATFYGPEGILGHQDKQMMTRYEAEEIDMQGGDPLRLFDTPIGRIGITICYDSEFPLLSRALAEAGAEIILVPSCTEAMAGFTRVRVGAMARALENQCVAVHAPLIGPCDWCPPVETNTGRAALYGPPDRGWPAEGILAETAHDTPGWAVAEVDLSLIRRTRADGGVLNLRDWPRQAGRLESGVETVTLVRSPA
ncbi:carbon-nitrogen hydrolase family protein [Acidimangrovimonas sediminis]|uniref:carbon-nitrogen hydrolase family protein n=1 Tax=Acidimangrovimonas sediminis TaxID=2056283 RepID=UPI000C7FA650|nr:carbon-nitrogen hydrolase family protein [Acidimangrovimonas sediminis]